MKRIDEKVAISGDGAELIQSYLNELNMKLLAVGIIESYSVVMEAETLFISDISELNKTTKVTVLEVQKIIEKHGTPDEIVKRYKKASEAELDEEFFSMDPKTKELIKRKSSVNSDIIKLKENVIHAIGILILIVPPYLLFLTVLKLNQYKGDFILFTFILNTFSISDNNVKPFIIYAILLIITNEGLTSYTGKLFISLRNTIRIRTINRSLLMTGAFVSYIFRIFIDHNPYRSIKLIKLDSTIIDLWIFGFIFLEIVILSRDHISSLFPLQPRFTPFEFFVKLPYILLLISVSLTVISMSEKHYILQYVTLLSIVLTTIVSGYTKYNIGLRFYLILLAIPMLLSIGYSTAQPLVFVELILIILIIYRKYHSYIDKYRRQLLTLIK